MYNIEDVPTVEKFMNSDTRHRLLMGPVGSGKSVGCVMDIIQRAGRQQPNKQNVRKTRWAVVRNTYKQLEDTTIKTWLDWFPSPGWGKFRVQDNNYEMRWKMEDGTVCECEILFRALDRPDQVVNLLSAEYTGAWFNEARHIQRDIWDMMDNRIGRFPAMKDGGCSWMGILLDTNPPDEDSWIFEIFEEKKPKNCEAFYQPSGLSDEAENIPNLPENYYQNIIETKDQYYVKVYVHGEYGMLREGMPVYPEYSDTTHCTDVHPIGTLPLHIGLDFGLTPAAVVCQLAPNGQLLILDEITSKRAGIKQFLDTVKPYLAQTYPNNKVEQWVCDPAGEQKGQADMTSPFDIMIDEGIFPVKGEQKPEVRLESVRQLLTRMIDGKPALQMSHKAKVLRKGFMGSYQYRRMQVSKERYADKPDKSDFSSHIHDALQYLCTRLFGIYETSKRPPRVVGTDIRGY